MIKTEAVITLFLLDIDYHSFTSGAPSDIDLMQTMISRIAVLEKQVQIQTKQLSDKVLEIL